MITTTYITKMRYKFIEKRALDFFKLLPSELLYFPLDVKKIVRCLPNCRIWSYQHFAMVKGIPLEDVIMIAESESGCTQYDVDNDRYLIMYNNPCNQEYIGGRQLFTIAHELGHIFLSHLDVVTERMIAENNIICTDNVILENEADYFAGCILSPFPLFKDLKIQSQKDITGIFGLSRQASAVQNRLYQRWSESHFVTHIDNDIKHIFTNYINLYKQSNNPPIH